MVKRRIMCVLLTVQLLVGLVPAALAAPAETGETVTILFTHDMHSHLLPASDETGKSYGVTDLPQVVGDSVSEFVVNLLESMLIIFIACQKQIYSGLAAGSVKG